MPTKTVLAQESGCTFVDETGQYKSTCKERVGFGHSVSLTFVDYKEGPRMILSGPDLDNSKPVLVYMGDGTILRFVNRNINWRVNMETNHMFHIADSELTTLLNQNIHGVRFWESGLFADRGATHVHNREYSGNRIDFQRYIMDLFK